MGWPVVIGVCCTRNFSSLRPIAIYSLLKIEKKSTRYKLFVRYNYRPPYYGSTSYVMDQHDTGPATFRGEDDDEDARSVLSYGFLGGDSSASSYSRGGPFGGQRLPMLKQRLHNGRTPLTTPRDGSPDNGSASSHLETRSERPFGFAARSMMSQMGGSSDKKKERHDSRDLAEGIILSRDIVHDS